MWQNFYWFFFSWDHIKGYTTMRSLFLVISVTKHLHGNLLSRVTKKATNKSNWTLAISVWKHLLENLILCHTQECTLTQKDKKQSKFQCNRMFVKFVRNISARLINWKLTKGSILEWSHINVPNVTNVSARQGLLCVINFLMQERMVNLHAIFVSRPSLKLLPWGLIKECIVVKSLASVMFVKNHLPILLLWQITKECIPERHPLPASFVKSLWHNQLTSKIIKVFMDQDIYDK